MPHDLKRTAHIAIGLPAQVVSDLSKDLSKGVTTARDAIGDVNDRFSRQARSLLDRSVEEGEHVVESLRRRVRHRREDVAAGAATLQDVGRGVATLTEPVIPLSDIDGIGAAYADKLAAAGVLSTRALVERCRTAAGRERLATQTGISATLLEKWSAAADLMRIAGVGEEHMSLLNRLDIGSIPALAEEEPADLHRRTLVLEEQVPGRVSAVPSSETFARWIAEAAELAEG